MDNRMLRSIGFGKLALTLVVAAVVMLAPTIGLLLVLFAGIPGEELWSSIIIEFLSAVAAVIGLIVLGGRSWASISREDVAYTFRFGWWCLAISIGLVVLDVSVLAATEGLQLAENWPFLLAQCVVLYLCIGVFEEFFFRGIIFGGLLAVMGGTHRGLVRAMFIAAFFFGLAHVEFDLAFVDALSVVQAVLKVIQVGMYAILMSVIVLRTRRLGGVSLFHALDDFVLMVPATILSDETPEVEYISQGEDAIPTIIFYLIIIVLYIPFVVKSLRELKRGHDVYLGPFMDREVERMQQREQQLALLVTTGASLASETAWQPVLPVPPDPAVNPTPPQAEDTAVLEVRTWDDGRPPAPCGMSSGPTPPQPWDGGPTAT